MNSVQETSDNPAAKALIFTGFSNRADGPAACRSVHETSRMSGQFTKPPTSSLFASG